MGISPLLLLAAVLFALFVLPLYLFLLPKSVKLGLAFPDTGNTCLALKPLFFRPGGKQPGRRCARLLLLAVSVVVVAVGWA